MKPRGLLFDKDGTLFDFHRSWGPWLTDFLANISSSPAQAQEIALALGFDQEAEIFHPGSVFVHDTLEEILDVLLQYLPTWERGTLEALAIRETAEVPQVPITALAPLFAGLKARGLVLGIATNDNEHPAKTQLKTAGVLQDFDFVAGYDSGYGGKPATGMQLAFCAAHGLRPAEVAMIGDSLHDMISGRDAGMRTIGVLTGTTSRAALETVADLVLEDISQLERWLDSLG